jgi:hypothetical protein
MGGGKGSAFNTQATRRGKRARRTSKKTQPEMPNNATRMTKHSTSKTQDITFGPTLELHHDKQHYNLLNIYHPYEMFLGAKPLCNTFPRFSKVPCGRQNIPGYFKWFPSVLHKILFFEKQNWKFSTIMKTR